MGTQLVKRLKQALDCREGRGEMEGGDQSIGEAGGVLERGESKVQGGIGIHIHPSRGIHSACFTGFKAS